MRKGNSIYRGKIGVIFLFSFFHFIATAQVSKLELKITTAVDKREGAAMNLLKRVVNINSGTMNFEGVRKVGLIFENELKELGFETRWIPGPFMMLSFSIS